MDAQTITEALRGTWYAGGYGLALCPAHGHTKTPALSLTSGHDGGLLLFCHAGCGFARVIGALRALGLVTGASSGVPIDPARDTERRVAEKAERERQIRRAHACWSETLPIRGTLAERYLRRRGVRCSLPDSLRFHPNCWHGPTASRLPAMVAAVRQADGMVAVHRTFLAEPGIKADVEPNRAMLGPVRGGGVHLSTGPGLLVVAEGLETSLSLLDRLHQHQPRVWAALSTSGMAGLLLPAEPTELVIAPDGDAPGRRAAEKLARRAVDNGWRARIMPPPEGQDWNDLAQKVPA